MNRPFVLRHLPARLRISVWSRLYRGKHDAWRPLYEAAPLHHAPDVTMELLPGDVVSDCIAFTGIYDLTLTRRVADLARRGGTLIDVGGNLGYFTLLWAGCNPKNRCVTFEASPRNIDFLRRNVRRNGFEDRVEIVPFAAGAEAGKARFNLGREDQTGWGGIATREDNRTIDVEIVRVDQVVASDDSIALLKVDVEGGADVWALMGCERLLKKRLVQEIHYERNTPRMSALGIPSDAVEVYLRSVGYLPRLEGDPSSDVAEWVAAPAG